MKNEIKKLNTLLICGIVQIVLNFVLVMLSFFTISWTFKMAYDTNNNVNLAEIIAVYTILIIILGIAAAALNITTSVIILASNWKSQWCSENKLLWGLLSLLILSAIGIIIFSSLGLQKAKKSNNYSYTNYNDNDYNNPNGPQSYSSQIPEYEE
ncbi:MAG: hypothetical protein K2K73_00440 [Ureaplasma sp.]|nr:hypothetical protein [Ureaplasma sp.]